MANKIEFLKKSEVAKIERPRVRAHKLPSMLKEGAIAEFKIPKDPCCSKFCKFINNRIKENHVELEDMHEKIENLPISSASKKLRHNIEKLNTDLHTTERFRGRLYYSCKCF